MLPRSEIIQAKIGLVFETFAVGTLRSVSSPHASTSAIRSQHFPELPH